MKNKTIYLPGLNGLRAIAALSVVISHVFLEGIADFGLHKVFDLPMAGYGVTLFFVISGFLITYLLIKEIEQTNTVNIRNFYFRRILRIWPIYYLVIILAFMVLFFMGKHYDILVPEIWYYIFFGANIPFVFHQGIMIIVHYWSIGVEEQFYIFWPWLVRLSKNNILRISIVLFIVFLAAKILSWVFLGSQSDLYRFLFVTRFHCMMLGAIGAFVFERKHILILKIFTNRIIQVFSWSLFVLMGFNIVHVPALIGHELIAFISLSMVLSQTSNAGIFDLENRLFDFIGKISYGIYVIHPLVIIILSRFLKNIEILMWQKYILVYSLVLGTTILIAWLSYLFYEKPFLNLKSKFAIVKSANSMIIKK